MSLDIIFSNSFNRYQIYETLPSLDWRIVAVNVNPIRDKLYFDLLIYSKSKNKLVPIFLNVVKDEGIEISSLLKNLEDRTLVSIYEEALEIIVKNQNNIRSPNSVFFTSLVKDIDIFRQNINPQRRTFPGLSNYLISLKPIMYYTHIADIIQKNAKDKDSINILDCSCGAGYGSIILGSINGSKVLGVDIDKEAIDVANMLNLERNNVLFETSSMESLALRNVNFDYVVSLETMEHSEDPDKFLSSAIKLLKDTGTLIMSLPHWRFHGNDLNSDHRTNWTPNKIEKFFKKYFNEVSLYFTEVTDLNRVLDEDFSFKESANSKNIEHIIIIANARALKKNNNSKLCFKKDKGLKVLFVNHSVPPYKYTGTPISTYSQMKNLKKLGYETGVIIPHPEAVREVIKEVIDGNLIYKVPPLNWGEAFLEDAFSGYNLRWYLNLIEDVLDDFEPDVIHINDYVFMSAKIIELFEAKGIPIVREVRAIEELCYKTHPFDRDGLCSGPESPEKCARCILKDAYATNDLFNIRNIAVYLGKIYARFKYINYIYDKFDAILFSSISWKEYMLRFLNLYSAGII